MSLTEFAVLKYLAIFAVLCPLELTSKLQRKELGFDKAAALGSKLG
jgi:hypothetical protein